MNFDKLEKLDSKYIAYKLKFELPQIIALILSNLSKEKAEEILNYFDKELKGFIIIKLYNINDIEFLIKPLKSIINNIIKDLIKNNIIIKEKIKEIDIDKDAFNKKLCDEKTMGKIVKKYPELGI